MEKLMPCFVIIPCPLPSSVQLWDGDQVSEPLLDDWYPPLKICPCTFKTVSGRWFSPWKIASVGDHFTSCYMKLSIYIILHHFTLHLHYFTWVHIILQHFTSCYISLHSFTLFYIILHHFTSVYIILHKFTYVYIILHHVTLSCYAHHARSEVFSCIHRLLWPSQVFVALEPSLCRSEKLK